MKTDKFQFGALAAFICLFPFCVGGYYAFYCALADVVLVLLLIISVFKNKAIKLSISYEAAVICAITLAYLITKLWAVDKTMSLYGFLKILTPFLFMLNLFQIEKDDRESLLYFIPPSASFMAVSTFSLGKLVPVLNSRFFDNMGDLHGAFEYANAFAIYALIAFIIAIYKPKKKAINWVLDLICAAICAVSIWLSDSRTVIVLLFGIVFLSVLFFIFTKLQTKKAKAVFFACVGALALCAVICAFALPPVSNLITKVMNEKTFVGRTLYWHDSFFYALHHPFGKGAYAFYYVQPQIQSARYYVIDVHNDYLQMAVELGFLPALAFIGLIIKQLLSKNGGIMQKMIILALAAHCFMDYDLQFMAIFVILILCIDFENEKELEAKSKLIPVILAGAIILFSVPLGLSSYYNYTGNQIKSNYYYKNTSAMVLIMQSNNQQQFGYDIANEILKNNDCIFEANQVLASIYAENNRFDEAIEQSELVIKKNPRDIKSYESYIDMLVKAESYYSGSDSAKAKECTKKIVGVKAMIKAQKANTNQRAVNSGIKNKLKLDDAHKQIIKEYKKKL